MANLVINRSIKVIPIKINEMLEQTVDDENILNNKMLITGIGENVNCTLANSYILCKICVNLK